MLAYDFIVMDFMFLGNEQEARENIAPIFNYPSFNVAKGINVFQSFWDYQMNVPPQAGGSRQYLINDLTPINYLTSDFIDQMVATLTDVHNTWPLGNVSSGYTGQLLVFLSLSLSPSLFPPHPPLSCVTHS